MESDICIVLIVVLILCLAMLLAWLAVKSDEAENVKVDLPPEFRGSVTVSIRVCGDKLLINVCPAKPFSVNYPCPADSEDPE